MKTNTPHNNKEDRKDHKAGKDKTSPINNEQPSPEESDDDYNLTRDDLEALGDDELNMDMGDDELLKHRVYRVNFSGDDLDVPGAELDDEEESIGSEDEENNSYSLGGDDHDDLEEDRSDG